MRPLGNRQGDITIKPDPAVEGQPVTIHVPEGGTWYVGVDGTGQIVEIKPNDKNEIELTLSGRGGETFTVTNAGNPPTNASFDIVATHSA